MMARQQQEFDQRMIDIEAARKEEARRENQSVALAMMQNMQSFNAHLLKNLFDKSDTAEQSNQQPESLWKTISKIYLLFLN